MAQIEPQRIVKAARMLLGWSQQDLAQRTGLALSTISRFEAGAGLAPQNYQLIVREINDAGVTFITAGGKVVGMKFPQQEASHE